MMLSHDKIQTVVVSTLKENSEIETFCENCADDYRKERVKCKIGFLTVIPVERAKDLGGRRWGPRIWTISMEK